MQTIKQIGYFLTVFICTVLLLSVVSCTNKMNEMEPEIVFPKSLTIEKILGITWKADRSSMKIINPKIEGRDAKLSKEFKELAIIKDKLFNSIEFSKIGDISISYIALRDEAAEGFNPTDIMQNSVFYYSGKWTLNDENNEELFAKIDSPAGVLEFKVKIKELSLLNNTLIMEAYFLNPKYSFSVLFSGNGPQEEYWNKETDVIDPSWTERNPVSEAPLAYSDIVGTYAVDYEDWKRVVYIDDITTNLYPLLSKYRLTFDANGNVELGRLPYRFFGINTFTGTWKINKNKVLMDFPIFPFLGDVHKYGGVFELDYDTFLGSRYARHNAGITMEIVKIEKERMLVKITELGMCSAYIYMNKIQ